MKITLNPNSSNKTTEISVSGDVITVDGIGFDLSSIPDNSQVIAELPATGLIKRINGELEVTIRYEYDSLKAEPNQSPNESDYVSLLSSGNVKCPIRWKV